MAHEFFGKWISSAEFCAVEPLNVFHRQLDGVRIEDGGHHCRHVLFRREFELCSLPEDAKIYISADDHYKLYINGAFVCEGPAPSYHFNYNYNTADVKKYLKPGKNLIAVHTLYQGLINRVWQSGDLRHGLILDLMCDGDITVCSNESFKVEYHKGFTPSGTAGYATQFLETYDSNADEADFASPDFDDSHWINAKPLIFDDHVMKEQKTRLLEYESVSPKERKRTKSGEIIDFGAVYAGYLDITARGSGCIVIRCGQELNGDGSVRHALRANAVYEEKWILKDGISHLDQFDYKAFRYAELIYPENTDILDIKFTVRRYPFELKAKMKPELERDPDMKRIFELCVHTQKYGVQEVIQDCLEREKGFYVGDGCYTALTNTVLTGRYEMARKLIDDAFASSFITPTLVTCLDCSFMQEIAEYPLMLVFFVLWYYRLTGDKESLLSDYPKVTSLLDAYREQYENEGLLSELDKWCVVEWPANFRHGYDADITEGKVCHTPHISINAYYIEAVECANKMAKELGLFPYRDTNDLKSAFMKAFYIEEKGLFRDSVGSEHISLVGNSFPFAFGLCPSEASQNAVIAMLSEKKISSLSFFCTFPVLMGCVRCGRYDLINEALSDEGAWKRMLREGATATFEGWGKDTKWNTSLFHLTMSYAALFMTDTDLYSLFK